MGQISKPWKRAVDSQFYDCHRAPLHDGWMRGRKPGNRGGRRGVIGCGDGHRLQGYHTEIQEKATFFSSTFTPRTQHAHRPAARKERGNDEKHERASEQGSTNWRRAGQAAARDHMHAPFLYSGSPVMSSRPSNFHPNIFSIGSMRLYVVQPVSLWNGTSSSPSPSPPPLAA